MPFTPFHMGPGIFIKALMGSSFSLMVFGWTQIVMDIQPLIVLMTGEGHLHGFSHTFVGATLIAIISAISGKYLSQLGLWILRIRPSVQIDIAWWIAILSAFVGSFSHVILDGIMHSDVQPFFPFTEKNVFLRWISVEALHKFCLYSGLFGTSLFYFLQWRKKKTYP